MREARLLIAGILLFVLLPSLSHELLYSVGSLNFSLAMDGNAHVTEILTSVDVRVPSINVTIYAKTPQNLIMTDGSGQVLHYAPYHYSQYSNYTIDTLGASSVLIQYDTQELTSQSGGVWNFTINTAYNYTLILPSNVTAFPNPKPISRNVDPNGQIVLTMPAGNSKVSYVFNTVSNPLLFAGPLIAGIAGISGGSAVTYILVRRNRNGSRRVRPEKILHAHPELRREEQEVVNFLSRRNGEAMESEIREAFEKIPKTTVWRMLKRLEEAEVVTLEKVGNQNRVKLR